MEDEYDVYRRIDDPLSHGPDPEAAAPCPDCRGTGKVLLLITTRPCETCGGTGKAGAGQTTLLEWVNQPGGGPRTTFSINGVCREDGAEGAWVEWTVEYGDGSEPASP